MAKPKNIMSTLPQDPISEHHSPSLRERGSGGEAPSSSSNQGVPAIKICGTRHPANIQSLIALQPNYLGFIFYKKSKRYVGDNFDPNITSQIPVHIYKVGVFVDEPSETLTTIAQKHQLNYIQLHGSETADYCQKLTNQGLKIIKAFSIGSDFDFQSLKPYQAYVQYFLFDTPSPQHGGTGQTFNWAILQKYKGPIPFFLAGGIGPHNFAEAKNLNHPYLYALDLNSRFELEPGLKDIGKLKKIFQPQP
jgi:phosphoribosylanthranilate isomerase